MRSEESVVIRRLNLRSAKEELEMVGAETLKPPEADELCWIDVENFDGKDLALVQQQFGFHPWRSKTVAITVSAQESTSTTDISS